LNFFRNCRISKSNKFQNRKFSNWNNFQCVFSYGPITWFEQPIRSGPQLRKCFQEISNGVLALCFQNSEKHI
jgi:hypothetical protein